MELEEKFIFGVVTCATGAVVASIHYLNLRRERLNQRIATAKWRKEYYTDFRKWSDEAMLQLSEAMHLCERRLEELDAATLNNDLYVLRIKISAQIDKGRLHFPNHPHPYGEHKQPAYRGFRHEVLDGLVSAYQVLCTLKFTDNSDNSEQRKLIATAKRNFTGEVQKILAPQTNNEEFRKLVKEINN